MYYIYFLVIFRFFIKHIFVFDHWVTILDLYMIVSPIVLTFCIACLSINILAI